MRMMCVRWVADILRDPTTGLNAIAGTENRLAGWPVVPRVEVFDETTCLWLAGKKIPVDALKIEPPVGIVVARMGSSESDALPIGNGYASVTLGIRVLVRLAPGGTPRTDMALIADQLLRNVERILNQQLKGYVAEQAKIIPGVEVVVPDDDNLITHHPGRAELDNGLLMDLMEVRLSAHDGWALDVFPSPTP